MYWYTFVFVTAVFFMREMSPQGCYLAKQISAHEKVIHWKASRRIKYKFKRYLAFTA